MLSTVLVSLGQANVALGIIGGYILYTLLTTITSLISNYIAARKTGLRIIVSPITPYSLTWRIAASFFGPVLQGLTWYRAIDWTCCWQDAPVVRHAEEEKVMVVSPGLNVLCTSDPRTIEATLRDWREFVKPDGVNEILGTFGRNVDTSNGDDWTRHRRIVAPCFSERASSTVWTEALKQSESLVDKWLFDTRGMVVESMSTLALNVISAVAFENYEVDKPAPGHTMSLKEALMTVMSTAISPALEGMMAWVSIPALRMLMPRNIQTLMLAMEEFSRYMDELIERERKRTKMGKDTEKPTNLIQTLITANTTPDGEKEAQLSDSELRGNIFIFTVGGLESTSATLTYAFLLLSIHPDIQDWVAEEIDQATIHGSGYTSLFPRLLRVRAIMFETLRLYSPSPPLPRSFHNSHSPFPIPTTNASVTLPPKTQLMLNPWPLHAASTPSPTQTWNPKRWIETSSTGAESLVHKSAFFPWGAGPRICPGMKFSQVEFCAVMVGILPRVRLRGKEDHVRRMLGGSKADPLLLHLVGEVQVDVQRRLGDDG